MFLQQYIIIEPNYHRVLSRSFFGICDSLWLRRHNKDIHLNNCPDIDGSSDNASIKNSASYDISKYLLCNTGI